jgi:hypothetical protein
MTHLLQPNLNHTETAGACHPGEGVKLSIRGEYTEVWSRSRYPRPASCELALKLKLVAKDVIREQ